MATTVLNNDSLLNVTMRYDEEVTRLKDFMVHLLLPITMEDYSQVMLHVQKSEYEFNIDGPHILFIQSPGCINGEITTEGTDEASTITVVSQQIGNASGCSNNTWFLLDGVYSTEGQKYYLKINGNLNELQMTIFEPQCHFLLEDSTWGSYGCEVGPLTTPHTVHCICNHLTVFTAAVLVTPNLIDAADITPFITFYENPIVVTFCIFMWIVFILLAIYAYRQGIKDENKLKVVLLSENRDHDKFAYLVTVVTGWRAGGGTTAKIGFKMYGSRGKSAKLTQSSPRRLWDLDIDRFSAGGEDSFILTTPASLGRLTHVEIWHDNTGPSPDWFLNCIAIRDLRSLKEWRFIYNGWLGVPREANVGAMARVSIPLTPFDELQVNHSYSLSFWLSREFRDAHLLLSVFTRPPSTTFSRLQRLVCLFTILQLTMLGSIMFHGITTRDPADQLELYGPYRISLSSIVIGIQVGLVIFPIHFIIILFFKKSRPGISTMNRIRAKTDWQGDAGVIISDQDYLFDLEQIQNGVDALVPKPKKKKPISENKWKRLRDAFKKKKEKKMGIAYPPVPGTFTREHYWNVPQEKLDKLTNIPKSLLVSKSGKRDRRKSVEIIEPSPKPERGDFEKLDKVEEDENKSMRRVSSAGSSKRRKSKSGKSDNEDTKSKGGSERRHSKAASKASSKKKNKSHINQNANASVDEDFVCIEMENMNQNAAGKDEKMKKGKEDKKEKDDDKRKKVKDDKKEKEDNKKKKEKEHKRDSVATAVTVAQPVPKAHKSEWTALQTENEKRALALKKAKELEEKQAAAKYAVKYKPFKSGGELTSSRQFITRVVPLEFQHEMKQRGVTEGRVVRRSIQEIGYDAPPGVTYDPSNFWFPAWCVYIGWCVSLGTCFICTYFTMLYGLSYGYSRSVEWSVSMLIGFLQLFCITHPLKIVILAVILVLCMKRHVELADGLVCAYADEGPDTLKPIDLEPEEQSRTLFDVVIAVKDKASDITDAVATNITDTWQQVKDTIKTLQDEETEKKGQFKLQLIAYFKINFDYMLLDILIYIVFATCVVIVVYGQISPKAYWHHQAVKHLVTEGHYGGLSISEVAVPSDFYAFMREGLIPNLYPLDDQYGQVEDTPTQTIDPLTHRVGSIRLRQLRITNSSCRIPNYIKKTIPACHADYSSHHLDYRHYNGSWSLLSNNQSELEEEDYNPWHFHDSGTLHTKPLYGTNQILSGGGYVYYLVSNNQTRLINQMDQLKSRRWTNELTRVVFVEFSLYNPHVNLFTMVVLVFEFTAVGDTMVIPHLWTMKLYRDTRDFENTSSWFEKILMFLLVVYMIREFMKIFRYGLSSYFSSLYNVWEIVIILLSLCVVCVYWRRNTAVQLALFALKYKNMDGSRFVSLYDVAIWQFAYHYLLAFLQMAVVLKFLKLLRFIKRLLTLQMVLRSALPLLMHFNIELFIVVIAFAALGHFLFGTYLAGYRDMQTSLLTLYNFLLGSWDYGSLREVSPDLAGWYFFTFVVFGLFFLLNMFVAILNDSITEVHNIKAIQDIEFEVLEYFYFRVKQLFGRASEKDLDEIVNRYYKKKCKRVRFSAN